MRNISLQHFVNLALNHLLAQLGHVEGAQPALLYMLRSLCGQFSEVYKGVTL